MEVAKQTESKMLEIGRCERSLLGEMVVYSLLMRNQEGTKQYAVSISRGAERESCFLGNDIFSAVTFFKRIVTGEVFPYSLYELVEDFWRDEKKCEEESA